MVQYEETITLRSAAVKTNKFLNIRLLVSNGYTKENQLADLDSIWLSQFMTTTLSTPCTLLRGITSVFP